LVVGDRGLKNDVVEYKLRHEASATEVSLVNVIAEVTAKLK
jgi:hypothetical protein